MDRDDLALIIERTARQINETTAEVFGACKMGREEAEARSRISSAFFQLATELRIGFPV